MGNVGSARRNDRRIEYTSRQSTHPTSIPYPAPYPNPNSNPPPGYYPYPQYAPAGQYPPQPDPMPLPPPPYNPHHRVPHADPNWSAGGGRYPYDPAPPGQYPPQPDPMPLPPPPYDHHHRVPHADPNWSAGGGRYPYGPAPAHYVEHQKAITIRNDVNLKKESLRVEKDEENSGQYLVAFSFDATAAGSITVLFFAKEGEDFQLQPMKESLLPPITVQFEPGLSQKFRQPSGTGIDFSMFEESELLKEGEMEAYPLGVKAETRLPQETDSNGNTVAGSINSQITQAVFEKEKGEYHVKVVKQFLWVNGTRYELQEIYGIGNSVEGETDDANDPGKECVICLSEPRDTTVLPCRHMCMCSGCAKVLRFQTNRCPICRQPVERLLEIKVGNESNETVEG